MLRTIRNSVFLAISFILMLGLLASCRVNRPDYVLTPHKMELFLYDYHLAQTMALDLQSSERYKRELYYNYVYSKHGISKQELERSLVWYTRNPREFSKIYNRLGQRVDKERQLAAREMEKVERKSYSVTSGDSVDLWYLPRTKILTISPALNKLTFLIPADTSFHKRDTLTWSTRATFLGNIPDSVKPSAYISFSLHYQDSVSTADTLFLISDMSALRLVTDSIQKLNRVSGAVNFINRTENDSLFLFMDGISLIRRHARDVNQATPVR